MKLYLIAVWGDVEPKLHGPFKTDETRLRAAKRLRKSDSDMGGIFQLDVYARGKVYVYAYSGADLG